MLNRQSIRDALANLRGSPGDDPMQQALPGWVRLLLLAMLVVQLGLSAALRWFLPDGWMTMAGIPLGVFRPAVYAGAVVAALVVLEAWGRPGDGVVLWLYRRLANVRRHPASIALSVVCLLPALVYITAEHWGYLLFGLQFGLAALLIYLASPEVWADRVGRVFRLAPLVVGLVGLGLRLWMMYADWVWIDEGYRLSAVANGLRGQGLVPIMSHFPENLPVTPWRGNSFHLYVLWARIFGLGLYQQRTLSYILGLLILPFVYLTARMWYGRHSAAVTASIFALSVFFIQSTIARDDALPMLGMSIVLCAHVYACQQDRLILHTGVGLLGALALETHLTNLVFFAAAGGYLAVTYIAGARETGRWVRPAPLWYFLAGALPGLAIYYVVHVVLMPVSIGQIATALGVESGGQFLANRLSLITLRYRVFWGLDPVGSLLILAAALAALVRRTRADGHWLWLFVFVQVGFVLVEHNGNPNHIAYGLPIFLGSAGALVTRGFRSEERPGALRERLSYALVVLLMASQAATLIQTRQGRRDYWFERRREKIAYVRENVSTDSAIIAPAVFYPYLVEYQNFINPYEPVALKGPALAGMEPDAYWQDILLKLWPVVRIHETTPFSQVGVFDSYMAARQSREVLPDLWVVPDGGLVTNGGYIAASSGADLRMVAHGALPTSVAAGETLRVNTVWIVREGLADDYAATLALVDAGGEQVVKVRQALVSGWQGTTTADWGAYTFHNVVFEIPLPSDVPPGTYSLELTLAAPSGDLACRPGCAFTVGSVSITD